MRPHEVDHGADIVEVGLAVVVVVGLEGKGVLKDSFPSLRRSVSDFDDLPCWPGDSDALLEHILADCIVLACDEGVKGALVYDCIKGSVRIVHAGGVHDQPLHMGELELHLLDHRCRDVDVDDGFKPSLVHLLRELAVAAPHHENPVTEPQVELLYQRLLQLRELSIPVEKTLLLQVPVVPELGLRVVLLRVPRLPHRIAVCLPLFLSTCCHLPILFH